MQPQLVHQSSAFFAQTILSSIPPLSTSRNLSIRSQDNGRPFSMCQRAVAVPTQLAALRKHLFVTPITHTHRWTASCVCVSGCHFYLIKSNRCLLNSRPLRTCFFFVLFSSVSARVAEGHRVHLVFSSCKFSRRGIHRQICRPSPPNIRADK